MKTLNENIKKKALNNFNLYNIINENNTQINIYSGNDDKSYCCTQFQ